MPQPIRPRGPMHLDAAQAIALAGIAFLAEDPARLRRFLDLTGLSPTALRHQIATPELQGAVLEHIAADESLLLAFAANRAIDPETIAPALSVLQAASR
jgi:hypothetical protein